MRLEEVSVKVEEIRKQALELLEHVRLKQEDADKIAQEI